MLMQHFLEAGHFWLFCNFQVMMWITWRRHQGYHKLTVAREFVAVTNELFCDFESWRENNKELCDDVICIPLNADLHVWLQQRSASGLAKPNQKAVYGQQYLVLRISEHPIDHEMMDNLLAFCKSRPRLQPCPY